MAKKELKAQVPTVSATRQPKKEINTTTHEAESNNTGTTAQPIPKAKRGRPAATTAPDEENVTVKLSRALMQRLRIIAVTEHTTLKEIFDTALRQYLSK